VFNFIVKVF